MAIAWISTRAQSYLIKAFRAFHWEIKTYSPAEFLLAKPSPPCDFEVIVFELSDGSLLDQCREVCDRWNVPVVVVAANLVYAQAALEVGADDFVVVPVDPITALFRVHKLARASTFFRIGELEIDLAAWSVRSGSSYVRLSSVEFQLLAYLARRAGRIVSYAEIMEHVWARDPHPGMLAQVKNCINRVRKKIEIDPHHPEYILTVSRQGYWLRNQRQWREAQHGVESAESLT
jgi:DNA-binding response OmpR family regulator